MVCCEDNSPKDFLLTTKSSGSYSDKLESVIITHVEDEAGGFVPSWIQDEDDITTYLRNFLPQPDNAYLISQIMDHYPASNYFSSWPNENKTRLANMIRDLSFTCNTRYLFDAYHESIPTYMGEYAVDIIVFFEKAAHGTDLAPLFWSPEGNFSAFLRDAEGQGGSSPISDGIFKGMSEFFGNSTYFAPRFQSHFVSHAIFGTPNKGWDKDFPWPEAVSNSDGTIGNVSKAQSSILFKRFFELINDDQNTASACGFWLDIAKNITRF